MKKLVITSMCGVLLLGGCEVGDDAYMSPAVLTPAVGAVISDTAARTEEEARARSDRASGVSHLTNVLELKSGIYGLPFEATIEEVVKWCADNGLQVVNSTEEEVKKAARRSLTRILDLPEGCDLERASVAPLEQELEQHCLINAGDPWKLQKVRIAQRRLRALKSPTVLYQNQMHYLDKVHEGMTVEVSGGDRTCTDDTVTEAAYSMTLKPGPESQRMNENCLRELSIFFYRDAEDNLKTYATVAIFFAQRALVRTALQEKYGSPQSIPPMRPDTLSEEAYATIAGDAAEFLGMGFSVEFFFNTSTLAWARNLLLIQQSSDFVLIHYDHEAATYLADLYTKALDDFKDDCAANNEAALAQMEQDF